MLAKMIYVKSSGIGWNEIRRLRPHTVLNAIQNFIQGRDALGGRASPVKRLTMDYERLCYPEVYNREGSGAIAGIT